MAKKYSADYRLIDSVDEKGRIRTDVEYVGARYVLSGGEGSGILKRMLRLAVAAAGFYLPPLLLRSGAMLTVYVTLPYVFTLLPLCLLLTALWTLCRAEPPYDRRKADLVNERLPGASLWLFLLPAISLLGEAAGLLLGRIAFGWGDAIFLLCAAPAALCGLACFRLRRSLRAEKAPE